MRSPNNEQIIAVACQDKYHSVLIFNWKTGQLLSKTAGGTQKILCMAYSLYTPLSAASLAAFAAAAEAGTPPVSAVH